ncbi:hypothetical protein HanIR_Chr17g0852761 [Helianthus annuus]|nr:hypothetical protein HanIR_Chr17g0852761 [Helianthus annuus]
MYTQIVDPKAPIPVLIHKPFLRLPRLWKHREEARRSCSRTSSALSSPVTTTTTTTTPEGIFVDEDR